MAMWWWLRVGTAVRTEGKKRGSRPQSADFVRNAKRGTGPNYRKSGEIHSSPLLAGTRRLVYVEGGGVADHAANGDL